MGKLLASEVIELDEPFKKQLVNEVVSRIKAGDIMKTYTVGDVAKTTKTDQQTIRRHIKNKLLKATKVGRGYIITHQNLINYLNK